MANVNCEQGASGGNGNPSQKRGFDVHVDLQYSNGKVEPETFAKEPWVHFDNPVGAYLSSRVDKLTEFRAAIQSVSEEGRESGNSERWDRVQHEMSRITALRKRFRGNVLKQSLMKDLDDSRSRLREMMRKDIPERQEKITRDLSSNPSRLKAGLAVLERLKEKFAEKPTVEDEQAEENKREAIDGFRAGVMYFKKMTAGNAWKGTKHEKCEGDYPNQKFPMRDNILNPGCQNNPLAHMPEEDELRYFHFPANNMEWIERAMAILGGGGSGKPNDTAQTGKILAREFWQGQMYGSGERGISSHGTLYEKKKAAGPIHARHMRSRCSIIPSDTPAKPDTTLESLTCSAQDQSNNGSKNIAIFLPYLHWETSSRRARMVEIVDKVTRPQGQKKSNHPRLAEYAQKNNKPRGGTKPAYRHYIGDYLRAVAKVAEEMDYEDDECLWRQSFEGKNDKNVAHESISTRNPLHVRRTLDQYYFPTLENTFARDKDQVVYRGTKYGSPRVIMVDQLWLRIINDNTIITSFPRRWGRNKPDPSGVHKSLRVRLEHQNISSIHHLALIIIDQCSQVFFDRTKPLDQRPEVMDLFVSAMGHVTEQTAIAYDSFWSNLFLESSITPSVDGSSSHHRRLDINPEGVILKEAQDIAEELRIMRKVFTDQWKVAKEFKRYLKHPEGDSNEEPEGLEKLFVKLLNQQYEAIRQEATRQEATDSPKHINGQQTDDTAINMQQACQVTGDLPATLLHSGAQPPDKAAHEAGVLLEHIEDRRAEIQDLEDSADRICQQLEKLLSLKQQQASIVEAKAALRRADESVKQGRAIMAFTLVTIFFLPLGFIATFFGMNNREINGANWMSLDEQIRYLFVVTIAAVIVIVSVAFSAWPRAVSRLLFHVPFVWLGEYTGIYEYWKASPMHHEKLERLASISLGKAEHHKHKRLSSKTNDGKARGSDHVERTASTRADRGEGETGVTTSATVRLSDGENMKPASRRRWPNCLRTKSGSSQRMSNPSNLEKGG